MANDAAGPADPKPSYSFMSSHAKMFHHVTGNQRACPAQPSFTVDSDSAIGRFADGEKALHDQIRWRRSIREEQVPMLKTGPSEPGSIVNALVQPDDSRHVIAAEVMKIRFRCVLTFFFIGRRMGSAKGDEFARDDPVEIAILHPLHPNDNTSTLTFDE